MNTHSNLFRSSVSYTEALNAALSRLTSPAPLPDAQDACPEGVSRFTGGAFGRDWDADYIRDPDWRPLRPETPASPAERAWIQTVGGVVGGVGVALLLAALFANPGPLWAGVGVGVWLGVPTVGLGLRMMTWDGEGRNASRD